jgi:hypothetical protein
LALILVIAGCTSPNFEPRPNKAPPPPDAGVRAQDIAPSPVFIPLSEKKKAAPKKEAAESSEQAEGEEEDQRQSGQRE